jgi:hypothetical protein
MIISSLLLQIKVFLFIMAIFVVLAGILHTVTVFRLQSGKLISSERGLITFGSAVAYIITMLICGF